MGHTLRNKLRPATYFFYAQEVIRGIHSLNMGKNSLENYHT